MAQQVNLRSLLSGSVDEAQIRGRIVLVGMDARSIKDNNLTPYSDSGDSLRPVSAVEIQAYVVSQLISAARPGETDRGVGHPNPLHTWNGTSELGWMLAWMLLGAALPWWLKTPWWNIGALIVGPTLLFGVGTALLHFGIWTPTASTVGGFLLSYLLQGAMRLTWLYWFDPLTRLPNRRALLARLNSGSAAQNHGALAVLQIGRLDAFRGVFSSDLASALERGVAMILRTRQAPGSRVFRIGEGDFAVLLDEREEASALAAARTLQLGLEQPVTLNDQAVYPGVFVGVSLLRDPHATRGLDEAYSAMHEARVFDRPEPKLYSESARKARQDSLRLEQSLRDAIANHSGTPNSTTFPVYYQPLIAVQSGRIAGFEALLRWTGSDGQPISPGVFIPVAESSELIIDLGDWVMHEACRQMAQWHREISGCPDVFVAVNLAARQLAQGDILVDKVARVLESTGLTPATLKLEVTESAGLEDMAKARATLEKLRGLGAKLSADDFGTGYSSITHLRDPPLAGLKLDRSFTAGLGDGDGASERLSRAMIGLAEGMGLDSVAEGVETREQATILTAQGWRHAQGWFYGRPEPQPR